MHKNDGPNELARGCVGVVTTAIGANEDLSNCYKTRAQAEARKAEMDKGNAKCEGVIYSVHLWNNTGKDGKHPDVTFDAKGKADCANWDRKPQPGHVNFDFGLACPDNRLRHVDRYHNPDLDGDGKGDYDPDYPVRSATICESDISEWQEGAPGHYQYSDFNEEVWCV